MTIPIPTLLYLYLHDTLAAPASAIRCDSWPEEWIGSQEQIEIAKARKMVR